MSLNWDSIDTYWTIDSETYMINCPDYSNNAIELNFIAYFTYGDERFLEGIKKCYIPLNNSSAKDKILYGDYRLVGLINSNKLQKINNSDIIYTLLAFKYAGFDKAFFKDFLKHIKHKFSIDTWLWSRAIAHIKPFNVLYYPIQGLILKFIKVWNKLLYKIFTFDKEFKQNSFVYIPDNLKTKRLKQGSELLFKVSLLHRIAWQLKLLPDCKRKRKLQKIALSMCPKDNFVIRLLLDDSHFICPYKIRIYKPMTHLRWIESLNPWINRKPMKIIKDHKKLKFNMLDIDYLKCLNNILKCKTF